jgi:integrase
MRSDAGGLKISRPELAAGLKAVPPRFGGPPVSRNNLTVRRAGEFWLRRAELEGLEESTKRQYRQHLRLHIEPVLGDKRLTELRSPALESFKDHLLQTHSRAMAQKVLTSLKGIFNEAVRLGFKDFNPALPIRVKRKSRTATNHDRFDDSAGKIPSKAELRALIEKSATMFPIEVNIDVTRRRPSSWHPFIVLAVFTGMRSSELRALTWGHVDFGSRVIRVRQRADFKNKIGPTKSSAGNRDIPMAPIVFETLTRWRKTCPKTSLALVFPSRSGRVHTNSNIHKQCWGPLQLATGITRIVQNPKSGCLIHRPRLTFHALRHTAASLFIEQGWAPKKIQSIMGHSSIQVTFDIYGKLWNDRQGDLAALASLERRLLCPDP